jgi:4-hydroxy-tetrahydrodipicolinate reductase
MELVAAIERPESHLVGKAIADLEPAAKTSAAVQARLNAHTNVVIDFSVPEASMKLLEQVAAENSALVLGTTGFDEEQTSRIKKAANLIPIVWATNMSLGVNLLFRVAAEVAKSLGDDFDVEIVEAHHNKKADAPSGTALTLAESVADALGRDINTDLVHGRSGRPGPRTKKEIGMHALRMGSVVGDHTVNFCSEFERIELKHHAQNRDVFASGAIRAAKWAVNQKPGLYNMQDVLFG